MWNRAAERLRNRALARSSRVCNCGGSGEEWRGGASKQARRRRVSRDAPRVNAALFALRSFQLASPSGQPLRLTRRRRCVPRAPQGTSIRALLCWTLSLLPRPEASGSRSSSQFNQPSTSETGAARSGSSEHRVATRTFTYLYTAHTMDSRVSSDSARESAPAALATRSPPD